jgi:hypothetical protein
MAQENKTFKIHRARIALNVLLQTVLAGILLCLVNYYAFNHYRRWDFSGNDKFALSSQTRQLLKTLRRPLKIIIVFTPDVPVYNNVTGLLKECQYASRGKIEIETVNPYRNFTRARELQAKYKFGASENLLILDYKGRTKFVNAADMSEFDQSSTMLGEAPRLKAFKGEQILSSALIELTEEKQSVLRVLTGHGEPDLKSEALATLRTYLERQNLKLESLSLTGTDAIPADAAALLIIGPKYDLPEREIAMLRAVWEKKGRIFAALDPSGHVPRLHGFLEEAGVVPQDDRVLATVNMGTVTGVVRDVSGIFSGESKVVKRLKGVNTMFLGNTQSLKLDAKREGLHVESLIKAADGFWGETDYNVDIAGGGRVEFLPSKDISPPLVLAAAVERGSVDDPRVDVGGGRMVVVGNADFIHTDALSQVEPNVDLLVTSINWLLDRDNLAGVAPKSVRTFSLNLTEEQVYRLALISIVIIPLGAGLLGVIAHLRRRR